MKFTKIHGTGNDFIIIDNRVEALNESQLGKLASTLCRRRLSIGADGLMAVDNPDNGGDYKMRFFNADGSMGEMCGNGARCIARYGFEKKLAGQTQRIETTAGMVVGHRESQRFYKIKLNDASKLQLDLKTEINGKTYVCSYVELGDPGIPHVAIRIEGLSKLFADNLDIAGLILSGRVSENSLLEKLKELGRLLRYYSAFPKGANVNFYDMVGENSLVEITYERGVEDFTLACGTGTGSVVKVLTELGESDGKNVKVRVPGGELFIDIEDGIYLSGPTNIVAEGYVTDEDLVI